MHDDYAFSFNDDGSGSAFFFCNADPTILKSAYPDLRAKKLWVGSDRIHNTHCEFLHAIFPA